MLEVLFFILFQRFSCLTIFLPISNSSFFLMGLRIAPSVYATDLMPRCFLYVAAILAAMIPLLPAMLLCAQLYILPELNTFLMKIPVTLLQSPSIVLLYLHKVNFSWFDTDKHMRNEGIAWHYFNLYIFPLSLLFFIALEQKRIEHFSYKEHTLII